MPGFDHKASEVREREDPRTTARNALYGGILFIVYLAIYSGFVLLNAFRPQLMARTPLAGINLAVLYGFALIGGALLLALIYGWVCRNPADDSPTKRGGM